MILVLLMVILMLLMLMLMTRRGWLRLAVLFDSQRQRRDEVDGVDAMPTKHTVVLLGLESGRYSSLRRGGETSRARELRRVGVRVGATRHRHR